MQFASLNGVTLYYRFDAEVSGRPVIVFANSLGTDFRIWDAVAAQFASSHSILRYDKRGHGLSDLGKSPYRMDDHIDDLAALLDHCGIERAVICGLSVGGLIAMGLAARKPELVEALILCDTAHRIGADDLWNERIAAVKEAGISSISAAILERWFTPQFRKPGNADFPAYKNMLERTPAEGYAGTCAALRDTNFTEEAQKLRVPTHCLVGEQDGSTPPALVRKLADLIPNSGFSVISNAGHLPCIEQPEKMASIMREFIGSLDGNGGKHGQA